MKFLGNHLFVNKIIVTIATFIITGDTTVFGQIKLSQTTDAVLGKSFSLTCTTTTLSETVYFRGPYGTIVGSCKSVGDCGSGFGYDIIQNALYHTTNIKVQKANRTAHEGTWKCEYGTEEAMLTVKVLTIPNTLIMTGLASDILYRKEDEFQVLVYCSCGCAYPEVTFEWQFINSRSNETVYSIKASGEIDLEEICTGPESVHRNGILINRTTMSLFTTTNPIRLKCIAYIKNMLYPKTLSQTSLGAITFPEAKRNQNNTVNGGVIAGIVIPIILIVATLVTVAIYTYVRKHKREFKDDRFHDISNIAGHSGKNTMHVVNEGGKRDNKTKHVAKFKQEMHENPGFNDSIVSAASPGNHKFPSLPIYKMEPEDVIVFQKGDTRFEYHKGPKGDRSPTDRKISLNKTRLTGTNLSETF